MDTAVDTFRTLKSLASDALSNVIGSDHQYSSSSSSTSSVMTVQETVTVTEAALIALKKMVANCSDIKFLSLLETSLFSKKASSIFRRILRKRRSFAVEMEGVVVFSLDTLTTLSCAHRLTTLTLHHAHQITDDALAIILQGLSRAYMCIFASTNSSVELKTFELSGSEMLTRFPDFSAQPLTSLSLCSLPLDRMMEPPLTHSLQPLSSLTKLVISGTLISSEQTTRLLSCTPALHRLEMGISVDWIRNVNYSRHVQLLSIPHLPLSTLILNGCVNLKSASLISFVNNCGKYLEVVDVEGCGDVGDDAVRRLARRCTALRELSLAATAVTDAGVRAICSTCTALVSLDISLCQNILGQCLSDVFRLSSLQRLNISFWNVTHVHPDVLLAFPPPPDHGGSKQSGKLRTPSKLNPAMNITTLDVANWKRLGDAHVTRLMSICPALHTLRLPGSYALSGNALHSIAHTLHTNLTYDCN